MNSRRGYFADARIFQSRRLVRCADGRLVYAAAHEWLSSCYTRRYVPKARPDSVKTATTTLAERRRQETDVRRRVPAWAIEAPRAEPRPQPSAEPRRERHAAPRAEPRSQPSREIDREETPPR